MNYMKNETSNKYDAMNDASNSMKIQVTNKKTEYVC